MSQGSVTISAEQTLTNSLPLINAAFQILLSNSSGTAFPTENTVIGMTCFRTDQSKLYRLIDATPTWKLEFDFAKTFGVADSAALADLATALNANPADNRLVATVPNDYNGKFKFTGIKTATTIGLTAIDSIDGATLAYVVGLRGWSNDTGGPAHEIAFCANGKVYHRYGDTTTWGAWNRFASFADVGAVATDLSTLSNTVAGKAPLASPALTGTPTAPTAASDINNTQIATTAFVRSIITYLTATQAQAEAGTDDTVIMTPLKVKQAIDSLVPPIPSRFLSAPAWAYFTGDGSDAEFVAVGGETISGFKQYTDFTIGEGLTVNVGTDPLFIFATGTVTINGTLNGKGGDGGTANGTASGGLGVGGGGDGASNKRLDRGELGYLRCGIGTGGGSGGNGRLDNATGEGGRVYLVSHGEPFIATDNHGSEDSRNYEVSKVKVIAQNGATPSSYYQFSLSQLLTPRAGAGGQGGYFYGAGGGGGGTIILAGKTVTQNGTLNVAGGLKTQTFTGNNINSNAGGGGGGASITIVAPTIIINGVITVQGGNGGTNKTSSAYATDGGAGWYKIFTLD